MPPRGRWYASAIKGVEQDAVQHAFEGRVAVQLDAFKKLGRFPKKGLDVAIDMHLIPRYGPGTRSGADPLQIQKRNHVL